MKKKILTLLALNLSFSAFAADVYNIIISKDHVEYESVLSIPVFNSCKEILDNGNSIGDGEYTITNGSKSYNVICDMTSNGGGWTLVVAQYEYDQVINWNEGIQSDYLEENKGFALNTLEIPSHTQMAVGHTDYSGWQTNGEFFNYVYTTGDIAKTEILRSDGASYHIARRPSSYYPAHDPEEPENFSYNVWRNTLTVDEITVSQYESSYSFSPNNTGSAAGYAYEGGLSATNVLGAWTVWVR